MISQIEHGLDVVRYASKNYPMTIFNGTVALAAGLGELVESGQGLWLGSGVCMASTVAMYCSESSKALGLYPEMRDIDRQDR